jgi:putative DNA-invertase from lambdoid prophage Rac
VTATTLAPEKQPSTASGKLMRTIITGLTKFERDLIWDRVKSGLAAARARG